MSGRIVIILNERERERERDLVNFASIGKDPTEREMRRVNTETARHYNDSVSTHIGPHNCQSLSKLFGTVVRVYCEKQL